MSDFHSLRDIKKSRKEHFCEQCGRAIEVGSAYKYAFGNYEGDPYENAMHVECFDAAQAFADLNDLWGEEWPWWQHGDWERSDKDWVIENYPIVAARLNWEPEP